MVSKFILLLIVNLIFCNQDTAKHNEQININLTSDDIKVITDEEVLNSIDSSSVHAKEGTQNIQLEDTDEDGQREFNEILQHFISESDLKNSSSITKTEFRGIISLVIKNEIRTDDKEFQNDILDLILEGVPDSFDTENVYDYFNHHIFINAINRVNSKRPSDEMDSQSHKDLNTDSEDDNNENQENPVGSENFHNRDDL